MRQLPTTPVVTGATCTEEPVCTLVVAARGTTGWGSTR